MSLFGSDDPKAPNPKTPDPKLHDITGAMTKVLMKTAFERRVVEKAIAAATVRVTQEIQKPTPATSEQPKTNPPTIDYPEVPGGDDVSTLDVVLEKTAEQLKIEGLVDFVSAVFDEIAERSLKEEKIDWKKIGKQGLVSLAKQFGVEEISKAAVDTYTRPADRVLSKTHMWGVGGAMASDVVGMFPIVGSDLKKSVKNFVRSLVAMERAKSIEPKKR